MLKFNFPKKKKGRNKVVVINVSFIDSSTKHFNSVDMLTCSICLFDIDGGETSKKTEEPQVPQFPRLSSLLSLDDLWDMLGKCTNYLKRLRIKFLI